MALDLSREAIKWQKATIVTWGHSYRKTCNFGLHKKYVMLRLLGNTNPTGLVFPSNLSMSLPSHSGLYSISMWWYTHTHIVSLQLNTDNEYMSNISMWWSTYTYSTIAVKCTHYCNKSTYPECHETVVEHLTHTSRGCFHSLRCLMVGRKPWQLGKIVLTSLALRSAMICQLKWTEIDSH